MESACADPSFSIIINKNPPKSKPLGGKSGVDKRIFFCGQRCRQIVYVWKFSPCPPPAPLMPRRRAPPALRRFAEVIPKGTGVINRKEQSHTFSFKLLKEKVVI